MKSSSDALNAEIRCLNLKVEEQAREIERLRTLSDTDPVTGIANRRRFDEELQRSVAEFHRLERGFCLVIVDIDRFKQINDRLGHVMGDRVLRTLAHAIRQQIRATDFIARLGGDEFAILLPGINEAEAAHIISRSKQFADPLLAEVIPDQPVRWSAGIAVMAGELTRDQLMATADSAMFEDKRKARQNLPSP